MSKLSEWVTHHIENGDVAKLAFAAFNERMVKHTQPSQEFYDQSNHVQVGWQEATKAVADSVVKAIHDKMAEEELVVVHKTDSPVD